MLVQIDSVIESFAATICLQRQQTASVIAFGFPFAYCVKPKKSQTGDFVFFFAVSSSVIAFAENVLSEQTLVSLQKKKTSSLPLSVQKMGRSEELVTALLVKVMSVLV